METKTQPVFFFPAVKTRLHLKTKENAVLSFQIARYEAFIGFDKLITDINLLTCYSKTLFILAGLYFIYIFFFCENHCLNFKE